MKTYSNAKRWKQGFLFLLTSLLFSVAYGQTSWPLTGERENVKVSVFKPVAESLKSNQLEFNAGIAIYQNNGNPVFGAIWGNAKTTISTSTAKLSSVKITDVRFPDGITDAQKTEIILLIENSFNNKNVELSLDGITNDLRNVENELLLSSQMDNTPPKIYFEKESSILVTIDGDPIVESTSTKGIDAVVNTPFLILKYQNSFYLSNGEQWYRASSATGKYNPEKSIPKAVTKMAESLKSKEEATAESKKDFYPKVIVSTVPAELIQTEGEPSFSAIQGTSLLFVSNTEEQLLFDIKSQNYYVLLSGRWFNSTALDGHWTYADPNHLPADFAKIPEGSDKDIVLANVPGTQAANEAIKDAQVPYTAAVERNTTATEVEYDGTPVFETIQGTNIQLATNSSSTVMLDNNTYYLVDNGIWFSSNSPYGPWVVSDQRPEHVNDIPPTSSAYNVKYVNIYHSTPEVVYVGYTSGYVSNYIAGPVIVYGTGYRYRPWRRVHYIPRPCTWGFGMYYNPWYGWSMNIAYGVGGYGWFGFYSPWHPPHWGHHRYMGCGWWGPPVYRPPYGTPYSHYYGHRGAVARPPRFG
ncbi:hypothetical protein LJB75_01130, partial [Bacteroidales bacterium OttesenSCG-928-L19]|nr:hypothetical protein [Bacteroidales bacterium OttesenSCG-928-L19]